DDACLLALDRAEEAEPTLPLKGGRLRVERAAQHHPPQALDRPLQVEPGPHAVHQGAVAVDDAISGHSLSILRRPNVSDCPARPRRRTRQGMTGIRTAALLLSALLSLAAAAPRSAPVQARHVAPHPLHTLPAGRAVLARPPDTAACERVLRIACYRP